MTKKSIKDLDVRNKRVLLRVDFNVPLDEKQNITDDTRIKAALPTIRYLVEAGAKTIMVSHLGRPKGKVVNELRMDPIARRLEELLERRVFKIDKITGPEVEARVSEMKAGDLLLLENVRFNPGEEQNDPQFAKELAKLADIYVNDAFGVAHRIHASTVGVTKFLPSAAGLLIEKELDMLGKILREPKRPFVAVLGGAKVSDKIGVIKNLIKKADIIIIGGGMANTFLKALGMEMGTSFLEEDKLEEARDLIRRSERSMVRFMLPSDLVIAQECKENAKHRVVFSDEVPKDWMALDIGPTAASEFARVIDNALTIFWNGPMGVFEKPPFDSGTKVIARALAASPETTVIGGGDSIAAVKKLGLASRIDHISTGGGASLKFMEGTPLPGVEALDDKE